MRHSGPDWSKAILFFKIFIYYLFLFIYFDCAGSLLWHAGYLIEACRLLSCGMHAESSSPARDRTRAPCIGIVESYSLDHQEVPWSKAILQSSQEHAGSSLISFQGLGRILHGSWLCFLGPGRLSPSFFMKGSMCLQLSGVLSLLPAVEFDGLGRILTASFCFVLSASFQSKLAKFLKNFVGIL